MGTCDTMTGTCNCKACKPCAQAWGGVACDMRTCPDDCNKNGVCHEATGKCQCRHGFAGPACEIKLCSNHGLCANGLCVCFEGFSGLNCSIATGKKASVASPVAKKEAFTAEECVDSCTDKCMTKCSADSTTDTKGCISSCHVS